MNFECVFKWLAASQSTCLTFVKDIVCSADMVYVLCGRLNKKEGIYQMLHLIVLCL